MGTLRCALNGILVLELPLPLPPKYVNSVLPALPHARDPPFQSLVVDVCDKGQGADLYMAGKSTATNGPSSFNVQMSDSYYYSC